MSLSEDKTIALHSHSAANTGDAAWYDWCGHGLFNCITGHTGPILM